MQKSERQNRILDVISSRRISRQDELVNELKASGFNVTQASVSRDLDEIGVVKVDGHYEQAKLDDPVSNPFGLNAIEPAGECMIVLKCSSGLASAAAVRIDAEKLLEIVGTIAGDDTIFIAVRDVQDQKAAIKKLRSMFAARG
jgi:transcriptional regulator of arginine metabolism